MNSENLIYKTEIFYGTSSKYTQKYIFIIMTLVAWTFYNDVYFNHSLIQAFKVSLNIKIVIKQSNTLKIFSQKLL